MHRLSDFKPEELVIWGMIAALVLVVLVVTWRGRDGKPRREDDFDGR